MFPFSERSEHAPPVRGTGHQGATYSVAFGQGRSGPSCGTHTDVGGPGVLADPGPFPRALSAPLRRVSISMTMKPAATTEAFKFSVSAKSAAALEKFEEGGHAAIRQEGVRRPITLNGTMSADAKPAGDFLRSSRSPDWLG